MNKKLALLFTSAFFLAWIKPVAAESVSPGLGPETGSPLRHPALRKTTRPAILITYEQTAGTVESVEVGLNLIRIKTASGVSKEFEVTPGTVIVKDNKPSSLHHVFEGDKVKLLRFNRSNNEIQRVEIGY